MLQTTEASRNCQRCSYNISDYAPGEKLCGACVDWALYEIMNYEQRETIAAMSQENAVKAFRLIFPRDFTDDGLAELYRELVA